MKPVKLSLVLVLLAAVPLFARSAIYGYWITVLATLILVTGALAALAGRTWGVGVVAAVPFALAWKPMAFFDRPATMLYAVLAVGGGIACALTWHEIGWWVAVNLYP